MNHFVKSYPYIAAMFYGTVWAMQEEKLRAVERFFADQFSGVKYSEEQILEKIGGAQAADRRGGSSKTSGGVAIIPIYGVISHRARMVDNISGPGGTSVESVQRDLRQALDNPNVGTIVFDIDSPGGSVAGVEELSAEIFNARGQGKKLISVSNSLMASAAYYVGSGADEVVVTPSGEVGSIGVYLVHQDLSAAFEAEGIKHTLIKAGDHKAEGNPFEALSADALTYFQEQVNEHYRMFTAAVARNRGVSVANVKENYGQGRTLMAKAAKKAGMVDRVETFDDVMARLGVSPLASSQARMMCDIANENPPRFSGVAVSAEEIDPSVAADEDAAPEPAAETAEHDDLALLRAEIDAAFL